MQKKKFLLVAFATMLFAGSALVSCSEDDPKTGGDDPKEFVAAGKNGAVVVNQGSYGQDLASWGVFAYSDNSTSYNLTLPGSLGNTPQNAVKVGDNFYVADNAKGYLGVYDKSLIKTTEIALKAPQGVTAAGDVVFAVSGDSVFAISTATNEKVGQVYAGSNIYALAVANNAVYVTQGMDWSSDEGAAQKNYVIKISLSSFNAGASVTSKRIEVGLNPYNQIITDAQGNVFVVCAGDFGYFSGVESEVWKIDASDMSTKVANGNYVAERNNVLFVVEKANNSKEYAFKTYKTSTGALLNNNFLSNATEQPKNVSFLGVNPYSGYIYFGSNENGYKANGFIYEYAADGAFVKKHNTGVNPYSILFY